MEEINSTVSAIIENATEQSNKTTRSLKGTPTGLAVAYSGLIIMSILPICYGSFRSFYRTQKSKVETMNSKDALMFPLVASGALFSLYIVIKLLSKEYLNLLLAGYFFFLGTGCLTSILDPVIRPIFRGILPKTCYQFLFIQKKDEKKETLNDIEFDYITLMALALSAAFNVWYFIKKHWIANNILGLAFASTGVELLQLNSVQTGCILLGGLFFYDIFWVFGTDVMVTVATSFEAPIKYIIEKGINSTNYAMLGLGDIVIPGIYIALLLRFDLSSNKGSKAYFYNGLVAYIIGLIVTVAVLLLFKAAQPALLYLVPACIGSTILTALVKGQLKELFAYKDEDQGKGSEDVSEKKDN
ncbi:uncharacterized protein TRIADDRAFT_58104 [Trichoplax adhaerens]|uniref:Minor histocompatibility antigen H13 n=1 Tax=Trichoplax adhaerens TaxID=10228 RepID=B3S2P9_TRIAD|nr:hypothetical protein TRIADDRAFT_58104 [Trichoplax adhaerens]EDV23459.1 hypothetical protein TRIADDRAFT_58104 [Trichoplax adhaerens]|eukprot:XP_002114369.1 hypothetical protein TRIADDRAFT_58104 [Trichoplax adhaerens]